MRPDRPKLRLPIGRIEGALEVVALAGVVALAAVAGTTWHGAAGAVPSVVGASVYVAATVLSRFPHELNYLVPITPENAERQYRNSRSMLGWLKALVVWVIACLEWASAPGAGASESRFGVGVLVAFAVSVVLTIAIHFVRAVRLR